MTTPSSLAKTCFVCGLEKPMNAFLQIAGPEGTTYGNVCASCRGSGLDKKVVLPDIEESGSSSTGLKIDAKTKVQQDIEKKNQLELQKERDDKEQKKREGIVDDLGEKKEDIAQKELKHRNEYIEPKKDAFLNYKSKKADRPDKPASEKEILTKLASEKTAEREKGALVENQTKEAALTKDLANTNVNLTNAYIDPIITGQIRYTNNPTLSQFKSAYLAGAAIGTIERQTGKIHGGPQAMNENKADKTNQTKSSDAPNLAAKQEAPPKQNVPPQNAPPKPQETPQVKQSVFNAPVQPQQRQQQQNEQMVNKTQLFNNFINSSFQNEPPPPPPKPPTSSGRRGK